MLDDERILRMEIPAALFESSDEKYWDGLEYINGWSVYGGLIAYWAGTIDLSGYARDRKTFVPRTAFTQYAGHFTSYDGAGQQVLTIVSSVPMENDIEAIYQNMFYNSSPGFLTYATGSLPVVLPTGQQDWNTVMFSEYQQNALNSTLATAGVCIPVLINQGGSLAPTASDTLYVLKIVRPSENADGDIGTAMMIPASRIVIPGVMTQEPDLEYMMRLSRSVQLANQV